MAGQVSEENDALEFEKQNQALTVLAATTLASQLTAYTDILVEQTASLADLGHALDETHTEALNQELLKAHGALESFDGGTLILNNQGVGISHLPRDYDAAWW